MLTSRAGALGGGAVPRYWFVENLEESLKVNLEKLNGARDWSRSITVKNLLLSNQLQTSLVAL